MSNEEYLYKIANEMKKSGLPVKFIVKSVNLALECDGIYELMEIWYDCKDERDEASADIQELIDERECTNFLPIDLNCSNLEEIIDKIKDFKNNLKKKVDNWGGISRLSESMGVPRSSLDRFFSSGSIPYNNVLYKIAKSLDLSLDEVDLEI